MKLHYFQEFADRITEDPERRADVERHRQEAIAEIVEYTLAEMRKHQHMTQAQLGEALGIRQASVSRMEHADPADVQLATLRSYIEALGGKLEVTAVIDGERFPLSLEKRKSGRFALLELCQEVQTGVVIRAIPDE